MHLPKDFPFYEDIPPSVSIIQRLDVFRYITLKEHESKEGSDTVKYIPIIKDMYPVVSHLEEVYQLFHSILMGEEPEKLDGFI